MVVVPHHNPTVSHHQVGESLVPSGDQSVALHTIGYSLSLIYEIMINFLIFRDFLTPSSRSRIVLIMDALLQYAGSQHSSCKIVADQVAFAPTRKLKAPPFIKSITVTTTTVPLRLKLKVLLSTTRPSTGDFTLHRCGRLHYYYYIRDAFSS